MRKIFTLLLALTATLTAWSSTGVTINGISYILAGDTATVIADSYSGSVTIPSTVTYSGTTYRVTSIGKQAFASCRGLTSVTIGNSVTSIAYGAFASCTALTSITIPNSVTSIGNSAFYNCPGLTSVTLGNSVDSIGSNAFYECTSLTSITIPNSVTSIDGSAFSGCSGLTSITVDSNNTTYDSRNNCNAIIETASNTLIAGCKNTVIPNSVDSIGVIAFSGCTSLSSITLGNSVDSIGGLAFSGCTGLTSITIPNSVTFVGALAFSGCTGLSSITCYATTPPTCDLMCFNSVTKSIPLYVPTGSVSLYQAANGWKDFTNIQGVTVPTGIEDVRGNGIASDAKILMDGKVYLRRGNSLFDLNGKQLK